MIRRCTSRRSNRTHLVLVKTQSLLLEDHPLFRPDPAGDALLLDADIATLDNAVARQIGAVAGSLVRGCADAAIVVVDGDRRCGARCREAVVRHGV